MTVLDSGREFSSLAQTMAEEIMIQNAPFWIVPQVFLLSDGDNSVRMKALSAMRHLASNMTHSDAAFSVILAVGGFTQWSSFYLTLTQKC